MHVIPSEVERPTRNLIQNYLVKESLHHCVPNACEGPPILLPVEILHSAYAAFRMTVMSSRTQVRDLIQNAQLARNSSRQGLTE